MADSVLGDVLQSALAGDDVVGLPAAFAGMSAADVREAFAALAEVGSAGVASAAAAVAASPADSIDDLLRLAGRTPIPTLAYTSDEAVLAGIVEPTDLDHRVPLELNVSSLDAPAKFDAPLDLDISIDSVATHDVDVDLIGDSLDGVDHEVIEDSVEESVAATDLDDQVFDLDQTGDTDDDDPFDGFDGFV